MIRIMDMSDKKFDMSYVMQITIKHLHQDVDFSTRKTWDKLQDFQGDPEKKIEIMETLSILGKLHKMIDEFKENNITLFNKGD